MTTFKNIFEAKKKKIKMTDLPKTINAGKYDDTPELDIYDKTSGSYNYSQLEYTEYGDYGDEGDRYNQGYSLEVEVELVDGKIVINVDANDLGRQDNDTKKFNKKYNGMEFDSVEEFTKTMEKMVKEFDKL